MPPPAPAAPGPSPHVVRGFLGGGVMLGLDHFMNGALFIEGAAKLGTLPVWAHAIGAAGDSFDFEGGGRLYRGVGGVELRPGGAGFVDLDLGYQSQTWSSLDEMTERHHGLLVQARFGIDVGGDTIRFRAAVEIGEYDHHSNVEPAAWERSFGATIGLAYRM